MARSFDDPAPFALMPVGEGEETFEEWAGRQVSEAPPLTEDQLNQLAALFNEPPRTHAKRRQSSQPQPRSAATSTLVSDSAAAS